MENGVEPVNLPLRRIKVTMSAALDSKSIDCAFGELKVAIGDWSGRHKFIFANITENAILGMDFLKRYRAIVDVYDESLKLIENDQVFTIRNESETETITRAEDEFFSQEPENEIIPKPSTEHLTGEGTDVLFEPIFDSKDSQKSLETVWKESTIKIVPLNSSDNELEKGKEVENLEMADSETEPDWSKMVIDSKLLSIERTLIMDLIERYEKLFQRYEYDIGFTCKAEHYIDTRNSRPIEQIPCGLPQIAQNEIEKQIKPLPKNKTEEVKSPWCSPILRKHYLVYLDDVIVFSPDFKTNIDELDQDLSRIKEAELKLKPSKRSLKEELKLDPSKIKVIPDYETSKSKEETRRLMVMLARYRIPIKDSGTIVSSLFKLTKESVEFEWLQDTIEAFIKPEYEHSTNIINAKNKD